MPDFKPSAVDIMGSFPPFLGTFDKTEGEIMAAMICRALAALGDEWHPIGWKEVIGVIRGDVAVASSEPEASPVSKRMSDLARNPFCTPNPYDLVDRGYASWTDVPGGLLAFTDKGFERLRKWVKAGGG